MISLKYPFELVNLPDHIFAGREGIKQGVPLEEVTWGDRINSFC